ncbi:MAG: GNAT family N-acetyltransferase [Alphaproteobacteria bacterium]|nr:GNAT family N-acetyltransferase [Alphaproteobacteria bacterium]
MTLPKLSAPTPITDAHNLTGFVSGEASLDEWLKRRALKNQQAGASRCCVVCTGKNIVGYYTLSAAGIAREAAPKHLQRNMPDPLPVMLLGRLAIDQKYHNMGIGKALLRDAMMRSVTVATEAGVFAILVHALSEQAKRFYLSRGFVASPLNPITLFMTLETVRLILTERPH